MSKAPKNIEKIVLGAGLVVGGALAAFGFMKLGAANDDFSGDPGAPANGPTAVEDAELISGTINSLDSDRVFNPGEVPSSQLEGGRRPVDLFIGVPLYADRENPNEPVDLLLVDMIHPPVPNAWWLKYGVDPKYSDSLQRDDDEDGFTNLEEFQGKTDPGDEAVYPPLIAKLTFDKVESVEWLLLFGSEFSGKWAPKLDDKLSKDKDGKFFKNKVSFTAGIELGGLLFAEEPFKGRFKLLRFEDRKVHNERLGVEENIRFAIIEDQSENRPGKLYEIPKRLPRAERNKAVQHDRTAFLELKAISQAGSDFEVEEGRPFTLPSDPSKQEYLLKEVKPDSLVVEWEQDGATQSVTIPRAGFADFDLTK